TPELPDPLALGAEFFRWEFAVAVAGAYLEINPFDQPDVQAAKDKTNEVLATGADPELARDSSVEALLARPEPGDYSCVQAVGDRPERDRRQAAPRERRGRDARLRPALPPLDRAAPQRRPEHRPLPPDRRRRGRGARDPRQAVRIQAAHPRAGRGRLRLTQGT